MREWLASLTWFDILTTIGIVLGVLAFIESLVDRVRGRR